MNAELADFRAAVDDFMEHHPQSPLDWDELDEFTGLKYYGENEALVIEAAVERLPEDEPLIEMTTNTGDVRPYRRWGTFRFEVEGEVAELTIYSDPYGEELFMPFRDSTNGAETYGAGRYMDNHRPGMEQTADGRIAVDFNYAYNPYCAYNEHYSCPLPPRENWLKVPIRAGEKAFK